MLPSFSYCNEQIAAKITKDVEQSIAIHQKNQEQQDRWSEKKAALTMEYENLQQQYKELKAENQKLLEIENQMQRSS